MKIKIGIKKPFGKEKIKKIIDKRIRMKKNIRLLVIGLIGLLILFSTASAYSAYQKQETTTETIPVLSYSQNGRFDYGAYLKPNTIYPDTEYLRPGQGIYFKNIIENITSSFTYTFTIDKNAEITGSYRLNTEIQTSLWTKSYPGDTENSTGTFKRDGRRAEFTIEPFEIDLDYYESIITKIEGETGVTVGSPKLVIKCTVSISAKTEEKTITKTFTPTLSLSLKTKQIEITAPQTNQQSFVETEQQTNYHPEVVNQRNQWTNTAYILLGLLVVSAVFTQNVGEKLSKTEKTIKKINKKYGEWIVELDKKPETIIDSDVVHMKTMEGLIKISEELTKPVLHYVSKDDSHFYYVLDESIQYQYTLKA
jgi:hypothetical protein